MNTPEKFSLKWNEFSDNLISTFSDLRKDTYFSDVTLVCADGTQIEAHKIILLAGSTLFQNILNSKKGSKPIIYMRGIKSSDLASIVDFLYYGEVDVYQENLNDFLLVAEELELKGMATSEKYQVREYLAEESKPETFIKRYENQAQHRAEHLAPVIDIKSEDLETFNTDEEVTNYTKVVSVVESDDLGQKMSELIEWAGDDWRCTVCGKMAANNKDGKINLRRHTQIHMAGLSYPFNICGKEFRCKTNVDTHISQIHKKKW